MISRNFIGARQWFADEASVKNELTSTASNEFKSLVTGSGVVEKTRASKSVSVFVQTRFSNKHAKEYIHIANNLDAYDANSLFAQYTYFADNENPFPPTDLYISNGSRIEYQLPDGTQAKVYAINAKQLIKLEGIQDRTLFYKNVRYGVGNSRVNKSIRENILNSDEHLNFFLYHNGITIVCEKLEENLEQNKITVSNYAVINGCQSMLTFFENRDELTNNLFVPVKIIKTKMTSPLVKNITYFANNQNSISIRDLRSNDAVQKSLQREFDALFNGTVMYQRKRGEDETGYDEVIERDFAAQLISSVYLQEPHNTHLKQYLFGSNYTRVFSRKITAEKIYLAKMIHEIIEQDSSLLQNEKIRGYGLALFFFTYVIAEILSDNLGKHILEDPKPYVTLQKEKFCNAIRKLWELMTPDITKIDEYTQENGNSLITKTCSALQFVKSTGKIKKDYTKATRKDLTNEFEKIFESA
ncbi:MAG: AIPR family protein [Anaerolineales bacterium]